MRIWKEFIKGIWKENPVLVLFLGMCPTLATSSSALNGLGMGLATTFVLACSNMAVSLIRNLVPEKIRIPCYIVVISSFVTVTELVMHAYMEGLYRALGIYIPLIVVNCIVLGRAEAFASRNNVFYSLLDGLGMGLGFTAALTFIGMIRELLSSGTVFGVMFSESYSYGFSVMGQAPGGFIVMGFLLAAMNAYNRHKAGKEGKVYELPQELSCRECNICRLAKAPGKRFR